VHPPSEEPIESSGHKPAGASALGGQREGIRRNFLRANTAVAIILVAVLGLALVAVLASLRATRHQQLAERAHEAARRELWRTYVSQSRAARMGSALDRRQESLRAITNAAEIRPTGELRNEAIAALSLTDFTREQSWPLSEETTTQAFDRTLENYAVGLANGDIVVRRVTDNREVQWLRQSEGEIPREQGPVIGLEFSPGGERLAARYQASGAAVWDVATAKPVFLNGVRTPHSPLSRPRFSSDGHFLICVTREPRDGLGVFDLDTGQSVAHFSQFKTWWHAAPQPGTTLFAMNTESNWVLVLDWRTGETNMSFPFPSAIQRMAWTPDGKHLAISGSTVDVHLWNVETRQRRILTGHTADVRHVTFDPSGERLASASSDGTSRIWETRSGRLLGATEGFAEQFGNERLALSRFKGAVEIWTIRPSPVHRMHVGPGPAEASTWALDLSPDGRWLASLIVDRSVVIWDLMNGTTPGWFDMAGAHVPSFHPARPELYFTMPYKTVMRQLTFDPTGSTPQLSRPTSIPLPTNFLPHAVALSRNGETMALGAIFEGRTFVTDLRTPEKVVWLKDLVHLSRSEAESPGASVTGGGTLALSGDGRWAACGFVKPHGTKVWDAKSGELAASLSSDNAIVQFSPDDRWLAAGNRSHYQLFRVGDWQELWRVPRDGALYSVGPCAFSPDGTQLAVTKSRQLIAILDAATGDELAQLVAPRPATIKVIRWSLDGRRLVAGTMENLIQVWEMDTLRNGLASMGLDWSTASAVAATPVLARGGARSGIVGALLLGLFAASVVTLVALLALRRHRRLIEDFARTEALAGQRERELQVERAVSRIKSSFVSMVSHEFRTPLGVITASAGSLQRYFSRLSDEQRRQLLTDITNSSSRMMDLIEEVLLLGKVESGKIKCQVAPVDVPALCRRIMTEVMAATRQVCPIELEGEFSGEARLDEKLIGIILANLLNNAVKYSRPGSRVLLTLRREGSSVVLEVRDEGIGIPLGDQKELFKTFHRGTNVGQIPGTGLGLTIVKRCIELHGGTLAFSSTEDIGTTFTVRLPGGP
jgi:signal transduction histidine kinase